MNNRYYNADGSEIRNANPGNYLVVPYNYTLGHAMQFASDVNNAASQDISPDMMMAAAFTGAGLREGQILPEAISPAPIRSIRAERSSKDTPRNRMSTWIGMH
ncbi:MAG: hypothetical protein WAN43_14145 [Rhodomicrobium sp.]